MSRSPDRRIGDWHLRVALNRLQHLQSGEERQLEPKMTAVLLCLAEEPGEVRTRDELFQAAWPGQYVTEHVLSRSISELRKALGDDARSPAYIETIRKEGYRLVAPVEAPSEPAAARSVKPPPPRWRLAALAAVAALAAATGFVALRAGLERDRPAAAPPPATGSGDALEVTPLTTFRGSELDPVLSPDGTQLAFAWSSPAEDNFDIYVKTLDAEHPTRLTTHPGEDKNPAWAPDGRRIAFVRSAAGENGIYVVPASGGEERKLADCVSGDIPDLVWTRDGRFLLFPDRERLSAPTAIFRLDLESLQRERLTQPRPGLSGDRDLAADEGAGRVAFARATIPGVEDLWVAAVDGEERRLTWDGRSINGIEWLDTADRIVFSSVRDGRSKLWSIAPDGSDLRTLPVPDGAHDPSYSRATDRLVFERRRYDANLWQAAFGEGEAPEILVASTRWDGWARWSPDRQRIAFVSDRSGSVELWLGDSEGGSAIRLTDSGTDTPGRPEWSPDGRELVLQIHRGPQADLLSVHADTGQARDLTASSWNELAPSFSTDGESLFYGSDETGRWQIWSRPVAGGEPVRITERGGVIARAAPDGLTLFYIRDDHHGLWRTPITGGSETLVSEMPFRFADWVVTEGGIYYRLPSQNLLDPTPVYRLDTATGESVPVTPPFTQRMVPGLGLDVDEDKGRVIFGSIDSEDGDIVLVDGLLG